MNRLSIKRWRAAHALMLRLVVSGLLLLASAQAPSLHAQSIDSLYALALTNNPSIAAIDFAVGRSRALATAAAAWAPPSVGLEMSMLPPSQPNPFGAGETMVMFEQEVPLFGQNRKMADAETAMATAEEIRSESVRLTLRAMLVEEYAMLWEIDRQAELNRWMRELSEQIYKDIEARYALDHARQSELYAVAIDLERYDAEHRALLMERVEVQERLNLLAGRTPGDTVIVPDTLPAITLPPFPELLDALGEHPELRRMEAMARAQESMAVAEEAMLDPMLMLRAGVSLMPDGHPVRMGELGMMIEEQHATGAIESEYVGLTVGAMISLPLAPWSRGGPEARADAARIAAMGALAERDAMRREMGAMLRAPYGAIERAAVMIAFYRDKQIPLLQQQIALLRADYLNNRATLDQLLDAYAMLLATRLELVMKEGERWRKWGELMRGAGIGE